MECIVNLKKNNGAWDVSFFENFIASNKDRYGQRIAGVWVLIGCKNDVWEYLNVGQSENIMPEIKLDVKRIIEPIDGGGKYTYINQFAQEVEVDLDMPVTIIDQIYQRIGEIYSELEFCLVRECADVKQRKEMENLIAWKLEAKYYRNGKPFKKTIDNYHAENIANVIGSEDEVVFTNEIKCEMDKYMENKDSF